MNGGQSNLSFFMDYKEIMWAFYVDDYTQKNELFLTTSIGDKVPIHFFSLNNIMKQMPLYVINGAHYRVGDKHFTKRCCLPNFEFIYTTSGCGVIEYESKKYQCTPNTAILIDCNKYHNLYVEPHQTWEYKHVHFSSGNDSRYLVEQALGFINHADGLENHLDIIANEIAHSDNFTPYSVVHNLIGLIVKAISLKSKFILQSKDSEKYNVVFQYIQENINKKISIEELSKLVFLSPFHFTHQFSKLFNISPYQYIINYRVNVAQKMLLNNVPAKTIVKQCGFGTQSNFYRRFKQITGQSPSEYTRLL